MSLARSIGALLIVIAPAAGQEWSNAGEAASLDTIPGARLRFERMLNTFSWNADVQVDASEGPWRFRADQRLSARLIRAGRSLRQEEYRGRLEAERALAEDWSAVAQQRSSSVTGPAGIDLGDVAQHRFLGGVRVGATPGPSLTGLVGWEWNRQLSREDAGVSGHVAGVVPEFSWEQLLVRGRGSWSASDLGDRQPSDAAIEASLHRPFGGGSTYSLSATYGAQRRDLPAVASAVPGSPGGASGGLLRREEDIAGVQQSLTWAVGPSLRAVVDAGWQNRKIERSFSNFGAPLPAGIRRSELSANGRMTWTPGPGWWNDVSMGFTQGEERHEVLASDGADPSAVDDQRRQARRRNHQTQRIVLAFRTGLALASATDLTVSASSNILRYDTPDTLNTDDRDELLLSASAELIHRLGPQLSVQVVVDGAVDHLVFLSRFQSSNNVTVRTLRFAPAVIWGTYGGAFNVLRAEVAASYSAFDFEDQVGGVQSYSYRQAMWSDSLVLPVGRSVQLEFTGSLRLFERGLFRWRDFRERPERAFTELALWPRLRLIRWQTGSVAVGFRSFRQEREVIRDGTRVYDGAIGSSGPTVELDMGWPSARIVLTGWRESQRIDRRTIATISNVSLQVRTPL